MRRAGIVTGLALAACGGGNSGGNPPPPGDGGSGDPHQVVVEVPATLNANLDVLFVIDDSNSMADKQQNLANNFPNFIAALTSSPVGLPDLHLGITTTDMGTKASGNPQPAPALPGCSGTGQAGDLTTNAATVTGNFISDVNGPNGRVKNYTGELATVFANIATGVGTSGCGFEQPLAAMKAALNDNPANAGFLRPDALLAVIILTDEDDCSVTDPRFFSQADAALGPLESFRCTRFGVTCGVGGKTPDMMNTVGTKDSCTANAASTLIDPVEDYRDFLVGLKSDLNRVVVSTIAGVTSPFAVETRQVNGQPQPALAHSCSFQGENGLEVADPGVRLKSFTDLFPNRSAFSTICQQDLSSGLDLIGQVVTQSIGSPCVTEVLADVDPATPGVQVDCIVEDVVGTTATPIQPCDAVDTPTCWKLEPDAATCPMAPSLKLDVVRSGPPDPATVTRMRCVLP